MMMMASTGVGMGDQSSGMTSSIYSIDDGKIIEPKEVDVLCGRGGMSNHHPGNEWYRRLIRSNRPLYRACPKHTKLLVAKAIVQAVEQQNGRFLERSKKNGYWYKVPYKRAVDKTSQGLRERERDTGNTGGSGGSNNSDSGSGGTNRKSKKKGKKGGNDSEDDDDDFGDDDGSDFDDDEEYQGEVPIGFRGSDKPPNLVELASVAITNEQNRYSSRHNNNLGRRKSPPQLSVPTNSLPDQQTGKRSANDSNMYDDNYIGTDNIRRYNDEMNANKRLKVDNKNIHNRVQHQVPRYQQQQEPNSSFTMQQPPTGIPMTMPELQPSESTMSMLMPLPPSMQLRESSMFRLLRHTKLLPLNSAVHTNQSIAGSGTNQNDGSILPNPSFGNRGVSSNFWTSGNTPGRSGGGLFRQPNQQQQKYNHPNNNIEQRRQNVRQEPYFEQQQHGPGQSMNAPTLTRLTTQVSDWLRNSFWPLQAPANTDGASNTNGTMESNNRNEIQRDGTDTNKDRIMVPPPSRRAAVEQAQRLAASIPPPKKKDTAGFNSNNPDKRGSPSPGPITLVYPQPLVKTMKMPQGRLTRKSLIDDDEEDESRQQQQQGRKQQQPFHGFHQAPRDPFGSNSVANDSSSTNDASEFPKMPSVNKRKSSAALPTLPYGPSESTFSLFNGLLDKLDNNNSKESSNNTEVAKNTNQRTNSDSGGHGQDEDDPLIANGEMNDDNILPHTELEQSVSTTLLKLAGSTPSMLLSGLTSFFDRGGPAVSKNLDNEDTDESTQNKKLSGNSNNNVNLAAAKQQVQATKKSKSSLLDDYEESPMEARLRTVAPW